MSRLLSERFVVWHAVGMTEPPQFSGNEGEGSYPPPPPQQSGYPPPGSTRRPGSFRRPWASTRPPTRIRWRRMAVTPMTGEPFSEKSKVVGGLLQLLGLLGLVGIGRIYLGYTGLGIAQLVVG